MLRPANICLHAHLTPAHHQSYRFLLRYDLQRHGCGEDVNLFSFVYYPGFVDNLSTLNSLLGRLFPP